MIQILDCTLRDGSYAIDFQFTAEFTANFCKQIENLKFPYVEIGHGMGIGASKLIRAAASSDHEYAIAATKNTSSTKWGMFAIPGVATAKAVREQFELGMSFVRIGIDALELDKGLDLLAELENLDIEIFVNFMKSYVLSPIELKQRIDRVLNFHKVKGIYLVDSAGGMMPHEIEIFSSELKNYSVKTKLGFHGHDNLGLAVYNSIFLAQNGFTLIDCSMQGIGRSSGNASTEKLLAGLKRLGLVTEYDLIDVLKEGEKLIRPMLPNAGHGGLDTFAGYMLFHTSYMENLLAVSSELCVDPYLLMQEHCAINQISGSKNELLASAKKVTRRNKAETEIFMPPDRYPGNEQI